MKNNFTLDSLIVRTLYFIIETFKNHFRLILGTGIFFVLVSGIYGYMFGEQKTFPQTLTLSYVISLIQYSIFQSFVLFLITRLSFIFMRIKHQTSE